MPSPPVWPPVWVNHTRPLLPLAMPRGSWNGLGSGKILTLPPRLIRPTASSFGSAKKVSHLVDAMGPGPYADSTGNSSNGSVPSSGVVTVKLSVDVRVPAGVVTDMAPELAPTGTGAVRWVSESTVNVAGTPLNVTAVVPARPVPEIDTGHPIGPRRGANVKAGAACSPSVPCEREVFAEGGQSSANCRDLPVGLQHQRLDVVRATRESSVVVFPPTPNDPSSEPSVL